MSMTTPPLWSSDTRISIPEPPADQVLVPMYGFGFTQFGLFHDMTAAEYEYMRRPSYSPELPPGDVVADDVNVFRTGMP